MVDTFSADCVHFKTPVSTVCDSISNTEDQLVDDWLIDWLIDWGYCRISSISAIWRRLMIFKFRFKNFEVSVAALTSLLSFEIQSKVVLLC